jgi:O-acetyl-ADP-ribose deacetylase (regulator of RNase III)
MSITYVKGDILQSTADLIVIPVNCVGVMGAGLALSYSKHPFVNIRPYREACLANALKPGRCYLAGRRFAYATTKLHWKNPSKEEWVEGALSDLVSIALLGDLKTIDIPALGCGCGGLSWEWFKATAEAWLKPLSVKEFDISIYEPK